MENFFKETISGFFETVNYKRGGGMIETLTFLILVCAIIYLNIYTIEVSPLLEKIAIGMMTYLIGRNTHPKIIDNNDLEKEGKK